MQVPHDSMRQRGAGGHPGPSARLHGATACGPREAGLRAAPCRASPATRCTRLHCWTFRGPCRAEAGAVQRRIPVRAWAPGTLPDSTNSQVMEPHQVPPLSGPSTSRCGGVRRRGDGRNTLRSSRLRLSSCRCGPQDRAGPSQPGALGYLQAPSPLSSSQ